MSSTTVLAPGMRSASLVEPVEPGPGEHEVLGLDAASTLGFVVERRRRADAAAAEELRAVTHWADLHRVGCVGAAAPEVVAAVQRRAAALAQLCRFHHRLKTHGGWTYHRTHDTVLTWTSPLGRRYTVDENGTLPLLQQSAKRSGLT